MPKVRQKARKSKKKPISHSSNIAGGVEQYIHDYEKRPNNPPVGLVTPETDKDMPKRRYEYDPHLDPQLQWSGKKEHTSFKVDTVSLHVHERIDPLTVIEKVRKKSTFVQETLFHYFEQPENNPPLREAIDFYKHSQNWSNRLIAGDSLLVMNSLLQKEGIGGKIQMIYFDPPYGVKYGSNFQPFVNRRHVDDGKDDDLTQEPEMIRAFRDTWELGIHSYLTYLRDRLLLARELLSPSGSIFVQISDENVHHVRELMDEVFGSDNFAGLIIFVKTSGASSVLLPTVTDYLVWYAKDLDRLRIKGYHKLFKDLSDKTIEEQYTMFLDEKGNAHRLSELAPEEANKIPRSRRFMPQDVTSQGYSATTSKPYTFKGKTYEPAPNRHFPTFENLDRLAELGRLLPIGKRLRFIRFATDFPYEEIDNNWTDTGISGFESSKVYVVQTSTKVVERCILLTTNPGDLVFDPTCGSGTTAVCSEKWGRRWITCDTSRVAVSLAKQRLMTTTYDYYELANPTEGISAGFKYKVVPRRSLGTIASQEPAVNEILYDQLQIDRMRARVSGPFTVEAVPAPVVKQLDNDETPSIIDDSIARSGATTNQEQWRQEILATGILDRGAQKIIFSRVEPLEGTEWLHADAETKEKEPRRVVISFGPDYAPLEQKQVARAMEEAQSLVPRPKIVVFASFQFDPEAAKDIDELKWAGVTVLRVQMNTDLLTQDLKKKISKSQSFWLMGQPDVELKKSKDGRYMVEVHGFDYYNTQTHEIESGGSSRIAMWMLDEDYDGRSLYPQQIFFPMADDSEGWGRIGRSIKAQINEDLLMKYHGTISLPFDKGPNKRIAIKIIDDRGIESLRVLQVK